MGHGTRGAVCAARLVCRQTQRLAGAAVGSRRRRWSRGVASHDADSALLGTAVLHVKSALQWQVSTNQEALSAQCSTVSTYQEALQCTVQYSVSECTSTAVPVPPRHGALYRTVQISAHHSCGFDTATYYRLPYRDTEDHRDTDDT